MLPTFEVHTGCCLILKLKKSNDFINGIHLNDSVKPECSYVARSSAGRAASGFGVGVGVGGMLLSSRIWSSIVRQLNNYTQLSIQWLDYYNHRVDKRQREDNGSKVKPRGVTILRLIRCIL